MAITVMPPFGPLFFRASVVTCSVISKVGVPPPTKMSQMGSWPGESPNHTMMRLASGRKPIAGSVAIWYSA